AERVDRAVPRSEPEDGAAARQLVDARDRARGDDEVTRLGIRDQGPEPDARGVAGGDGEGDVQLAEDGLGVGHAQQIEPRLFSLAAQAPEVDERLWEEHDAESRAGARHGLLSARGVAGSRGDLIMLRPTRAVAPRAIASPCARPGPGRGSWSRSRRAPSR